MASIDSTARRIFSMYTPKVTPMVSPIASGRAGTTASITSTASSEAIQAAKPGTHVASTSNEAVISGAVNLTDYNVVIWILGNESTANDTFNATEQTKVTQFLAAGGNLFVSGSEIGWDLDQQNNGRTFYENTLKANYVSDDAGTYTATVVASPGIFSGLAALLSPAAPPPLCTQRAMTRYTT